MFARALLLNAVLVAGVCATTTSTATAMVNETATVNATATDSATFTIIPADTHTINLDFATTKDKLVSGMAQVVNLLRIALSDDFTRCKLFCGFVESAAGNRALEKCYDCAGVALRMRSASALAAGDETFVATFTSATAMSTAEAFREVTNIASLLRDAVGATADPGISVVAISTATLTGAALSDRYVVLDLVCDRNDLVSGMEAVEEAVKDAVEGRAPEGSRVCQGFCEVEAVGGARKACYDCVGIRAARVLATGDVVQRLTLKVASAMSPAEMRASLNDPAAKAAIKLAAKASSVTVAYTGTTPPPTATRVVEPADDDDSGLDGGIIALIVIICVVVVLAVAAFVYVKVCGGAEQPPEENEPVGHKA